MIIVGMDPGSKGAIVGIDERKKIRFGEVMPMTGKEINIVALIRFLSLHTIDHVFLEHSQALPKIGGKNVSPTTMFTFGHNFACCKCAIVANKIPYTLIKPRRWQKIAWMGTSPSEKPKMRSRQAALKLFPGFDLRATERCKVPHEGIVDAANIAWAGAIYLNGS